MGQFRGFPSRTKYAPLPLIFFSVLLPEISDLLELKLTLYIIASLYQKRGYPRFTTKDELLSNVGLRRCLRATEGTEEEALGRALEAATRRGTIIHVSEYGLYLLNTEKERETAEKIKRGEIPLPNVRKKAGIPSETESLKSDESPDIFTAYEENIGMLTPLIADFLKEAEKTYPRKWILDAMKEAVSLEKRSWRYVAGILRRWQSEGRSDGTYRRHSEKKPDPAKYIRGKYGHMVQR